MNPYQPGEDNQDLYTVGFQAGAASRDVEVQRLQSALADAEALELGTAEKCDQLCEQVEVLREALLTCSVGDFSTGHVMSCTRVLMKSWSKKHSPPRNPK